jgi:hypothetical protein
LDELLGFIAIGLLGDYVFMKEDSGILRMGSDRVFTNFPILPVFPLFIRFANFSEKVKPEFVNV